MAKACRGSWIIKSVSSRHRLVQIGRETRRSYHNNHLTQIHQVIQVGEAIIPLVGHPTRPERIGLLDSLAHVIECQIISNWALQRLQCVDTCLVLELWLP